jgi:hypothetical protein
MEEKVLFKNRVFLLEFFWPDAFGLKKVLSKLTSYKTERNSSDGNYMFKGQVQNGVT